MKNTKWSSLKKFMIFIFLPLLVAAGVFVYLYFFGKLGRKVDYNKLYQDNKTVEQINKGEQPVEAPVFNETEKNLEVVTESATSSEADSLASSSEEMATSSEVLAVETASSSEVQVIDEIIPKANGELLIKVLNGGGVAGMANKVVELIGQKRYEAAQVGNADNYNYETTLIRYKKGDMKYAEEIKSLIDRKAIVEEASGQEEDVVVIIGKSFVPSN